MLDDEKLVSKSVRVPERLWWDARRAAARRGMDLQGWLIWLLERAVAEELGDTASKGAKR